ncbi:MAG: NADPH-dependent F420 reductase [Candidatus Hodarchaeaceae archaeon]|nr:NADPH-dependent F420 reductase [Candidatus Hodarchaeaceae archaeon]
MIAVIGGTGAQGRGLVARLALAGENVIIGSRQREKAELVASQVSERTGKSVRGATNLEAARAADIVVLSVPFKAMKRIIEDIKPALSPGKILVNVVVPIELRRGVIVVEQPRAGSATEELARLVPKGVRVVSGFQTIGAKRIQDISTPLDCDVVVCGDDLEAKQVVMKLAEKMPSVRAIDGGPLCNSRFVEPMVALLVELTRRYKTAGVGIRFEGL